MAEGLLSRIRAEYAALPGLKLTLPQACRLWSVDERVCDLAFNVLIQDGVLARSVNGTYVTLPGAERLLRPLLTIGRCPHCQKLNTFRQEDGISRCIACRRILVLKSAVA